MADVRVVGAGPTGVEMAGQIAEIARDTLRRDFRTSDPTRGRIPLIEAVEPDLTLTGHPEVFALGDMVRVRGDDGSPVTSRALRRSPCRWGATRRRPSAPG